MSNDKKERHFIVFFKLKAFWFFNRWEGNASITETGFPNRYNLKSHLAKANNWNPDKICITNIIELSQQDFNDWNS